jgi:hypothetical protein
MINQWNLVVMNKTLLREVGVGLNIIVSSGYMDLSLTKCASHIFISLMVNPFSVELF